MAPHSTNDDTAASADHRPEPDALDHARSLATAFYRKYIEDDVSIHAMSLTYATILSIVPLLAVTFSGLKAFGVHNQIEPVLSRSLAPLGPGGAALSERIVEFVQNLQVGVLGAVGVAGLFYTVVTLVSSVENALNRIWRVRHGRNMGRKFRDYLSVIMVGPVLVFSALALTASAQQLALVQRVFALAPWLLWIGTVILPYLLLCGGFTLLYRFIPNTSVNWSAALVGGVCCGIAWNIAGSAFTAFVASSGRYAAIYSSFAILLLFIIWIYTSWLIVLVAAEIAYLWQHPTDVLSRLRDLTIAAHEKNGLTLLTTLARGHLAGKPPLSPERLTVETELSASMVDEIVDRMIDHNILLQSERPPGITLARPPESVSVVEVLQILRGDIGEEPHRHIPAAISSAIERRNNAVASALSDLTLETLARSDEAGNPGPDLPPDETED